MVLQPWLESLFQSELDVLLFVASNPLLGGFAPMDKSGTKVAVIIEGCFVASMGGSLDT